MKKKLLLTSILSIVMCVSLIAGATFALFTSESKVNVAVTSGKVDVVATVNEDSVYTKRLYDTEYTSGDDRMYEARATFDNGDLTVANMVAGDGIKFDIDVTNNSTVTVKYRTIIACESDNSLFEGFSVTIDGSSYTGATKISDYSFLAVGANGTKISVAIELPEDAGSEYQGKTLKLSFKVEAVQGNAETEDFDENTVYIYNANDLVALQSKSGVSKIEFVNNIDMTGKAYTGLLTNNLVERGVTVKGNGHYISGLKSALFKDVTYEVSIDGLTIKNSTITKHYVTSDYTCAGAFIAYIDTSRATLTNCHLDGVSVEHTANGYSGMIGYATVGITVKNCTVNKSSFKSAGSVGAIVGHVYGPTTIDNCKVLGATSISCTENRGNSDAKAGYFVGTAYGSSQAYAPTITEDYIFNNVEVASTVTLTNVNAKEPLAGGFIGRKYFVKIIVDGGEWVADGVTRNADGEYLISNANGLFYCATTFNTSEATSDKVFKLTQNIDMMGVAWTPWCNDAQYFCGTFDGQNKTIKNLTIVGTSVEASDSNCQARSTGFIGRLGANGSSDNKLCNVTFDNANVSGYHCVGVAVGTNEFGKVVNVHVTNSTVTNNHANAQQCGDKAGAIIGYNQVNAGYIEVSDCSATNCVIKGARDVGQLIGAGYQYTDGTWCGTYSNLTATNVTVGHTEGCDDSSNGANINAANPNLVGRVIGAGANPNA